MALKVYISGMSGNKEVKKRQQRVLMILDSKNIKYEIVDITEPGKESEKDTMQTKSTRNGATVSDPSPRHPLPPQLFNDAEYCGDYDAFDLANEIDTLEEFLKVAPTERTSVSTAKIELKKENGVTATGETTEAVETPTAAAADEEGESKEVAADSDDTKNGKANEEESNEGGSEQGEECKKASTKDTDKGSAKKDNENESYNTLETATIVEDIQDTKNKAAANDEHETKPIDVAENASAKENDGTSNTEKETKEESAKSSEVPVEGSKIEASQEYTEGITKDQAEKVNTDEKKDTTRDEQDDEVNESTTGKDKQEKGNEQVKDTDNKEAVADWDDKQVETTDSKEDTSKKPIMEKEKSSDEPSGNIQKQDDEEKENEADDLTDDVVTKEEAVVEVTALPPTNEVVSAPEQQKDKGDNNESIVKATEDPVKLESEGLITSEKVAASN